MKIDVWDRFCEKEVGNRCDTKLYEDGLLCAAYF